MKTSSFDTEGLNGLFDAPAFEIDFDTEMSVPNGKERIRAYSDRYYEWIGHAKSIVTKALPKVAATIKSLVAEKDACGFCRTRGYWFAKIDGKIRKQQCPRCMGKGHICADDRARTAKFFERKGKGLPMDKSARDYVIAA